MEKYKVLTTLKHNGTYYQAGETVELKKEDAKWLLSRNVIGTLTGGEQDAAAPAMRGNEGARAGTVTSANAQGTVKDQPGAQGTDDAAKTGEGDAFVAPAGGEFKGPDSAANTDPDKDTAIGSSADGTGQGTVNTDNL